MVSAHAEMIAPFSGAMCARASLYRQPRWKSDLPVSGVEGRARFRYRRVDDVLSEKRWARPGCLMAWLLGCLRACRCVGHHQLRLESDILVPSTPYGVRQRKVHSRAPIPHPHTPLAR